MSTPLAQALARRSARGVMQKTEPTPPVPANNRDSDDDDDDDDDDGDDDDDSYTDSSYTSDSESSESSSSNNNNNNDNKLREALDDGVLTVRKNFQEFCVFLDIKKELRSEFLSSLWNHVAQGQYEWETLASDLPKRRECATSFITKVGVKYWGTEENRRRCLMPDSFDSPELMFTYPERKKELIRVIMILLEKKAKSEVNGTQPRKRPLKAVSPKNGFSPSLSDSPCPPERQKKERRRGDAGRRSSAVYPDLDVFDSDFDMEDSKATVEVVVSSPRKGDSAASSPAPKFASTSTFQSKTKKKDVSKNNARASLDFSMDSTANGKKQVDHSNKSVLRNGASRNVEFAHLEERFGMNTGYFVRATSQEGMAPVFVPFQLFDTVSGFLETMEEETHLQEWNPTAQLDVELHRQICSNDPSVNARIYRVFAASVRFEWSNFEIRLRPGHDGDLRKMEDELRQSWLKGEQKTNSEESLDETNGGNRETTSFNIHVMLHVAPIS